MKLGIAMALLMGAALAHGQTNAKKELVQQLLGYQKAGLEDMARMIVERPAMQTMQAANNALQTQPPSERRDTAGRAIEAEVRKFVDESVPVLRERALKIAPESYGAALEEKFSEAELKQLVAWYGSDVNKKYQQTVPDLQNAFAQKLVAEAGPLLDGKLTALQQKVRTLMGAPVGSPSPAARASSPAAKPAAKAASK
jgi:hypothetical protein